MNGTYDIASTSSITDAFEEEVPSSQTRETTSFTGRSITGSTGDSLRMISPSSFVCTDCVLCILIFTSRGFWSTALCCSQEGKTLKQYTSSVNEDVSSDSVALPFSSKYVIPCLVTVATQSSPSFDAVTSAIFFGSPYVSLPPTTTPSVSIGIVIS